MTIREIDTICYVGAGTMGRANSLVAAISGYNAVIYDIAEENLAGVVAYQSEFGAYLVENGYCSAQELAAAPARVTCVSDLAEAVANADLVSESVIEELAIKREVHRKLDQICPERTILTTNTSGLLVSNIESAVVRGDRFAALHSHLRSPLVDIVGGPRTSAATIDILTRYVLSTKLVPLVLHRENPGYVLNALLGPVVTTAMLLVIEGVASKEDVDRAWMRHRRTSVGPFGLMDQFGLNVVYDGWQHRSRDTVTDVVKPQILAFLEPYLGKGELGLKSGKGFYDYPNPAYEQPEFLSDDNDNSIPHFALTLALVGNAILLAAKDIADQDKIDMAWTVGMSQDTGPFAVLKEIGMDVFLQLLGNSANMFAPDDVASIRIYLTQMEKREHVGG
ncbi:MAG: 3-hydroxyacyl-CoA dehydrogenase NAD-binding domain-containing protein [Gammaproteobacteria bacterium]|nr:3-hydroxyacyl-CoA dehydrogenase NAD-binding domain-containing protein [Gammaproteobacteria bacterium]MDH3429626.1 3-hydroxyacyl-CoA dehydrogenase NAD-binding domain-containing protein [Gammaproteobacteria bacterium]MDH3432370.1 3-hydroxyacyl-CoA dehydrogenase NAD-binding domain-containing protein [Gammaproteobacteria bacterium]